MTQQVFEDGNLRYVKDSGTRTVTTFDSDGKRISSRGFTASEIKTEEETLKKNKEIQEVEEIISSLPLEIDGLLSSSVDLKNKFYSSNLDIDNLYLEVVNLQENMIKVLKVLSARL